MDDKVTEVLLGTTVAVALGVPVEFKFRKYLEQHPVTGMTGNGTNNQPPCTWSDSTFSFLGFRTV